MWTCPKCGAKVDPAFDVCWKCGTARDGTEDPTFVCADDLGPIPLDADKPGEPTGTAEVLDGPAAELVPCYQAYSLIEAQFLANELSENGIPAVCDEQDMQDMLGGWSGNPRVYCHEGDLARARAFLAEYEKKKAGHNPLEL
ncbi:MAG: hypothetical protein JWN86_4758 [Planctomycetota bacterium]|nr:hypothetical protein [Planctomycetota bacterium]